jgi:hypothetical protein
MLELDTNKRTLHFFVNNVIQPVCVTNIPLQCCFLIMSVGKTDRIGFKSLLYRFNPSYDVKFTKKCKNEKLFYTNY